VEIGSRRLYDSRYKRNHKLTANSKTYIYIKRIYRYLQNDVNETITPKAPAQIVHRGLTLPDSPEQRPSACSRALK
jgi:hypothetical protein